MRVLFRLLLICITIISWNAYASQNDKHQNNEQFLSQPIRFPEDKNVLGHIFRNSQGHFIEDTQQNREYILKATANCENRVGINNYSEEIYCKVMPNGYQAWALVKNGMIKNGGCNRYAQKWIPNASQRGGDMVPITYQLKEPTETDFKVRLLFNKMADHYNASHPKKPIVFPHLKGINQGVEQQAGLILNLFENDNPEMGEHAFFMPTDDDLALSEEEILQILSELAVGIFIHDTIPFVSIHFNWELAQYPIIHPIYQNTLIGHTLSMLDYYMKGLVNGMYYDETFIHEWEKNPVINDKLFKKNSLNFQEYVQKQLNERYLTLKEIYKHLEKELPNTSMINYSLSHRQFRIVAKQDAIKRSDNLFLINGDFDINYSIKVENAIDPIQDKLEKRASEFMCEQIKIIMPRLPLFKKHFQALSLINFFTYYFSTLKEAGKAPILTPQRFAKKNISCPSIFPPLCNTSSDENVKIKILELLDALPSGDKQIVTKYIKGQDGLETEAVKAIAKAFYRLALSGNSFDLHFDFVKHALEFLKGCKATDKKVSDKMDAALVQVKLKKPKEPITEKMIQSLIAQLNASLKKTYTLIVDVEKEIREAKRRNRPCYELVAELNELEKMYDGFFHDKQMWQLWSQGSFIPSFQKMIVELDSVHNKLRAYPEKYQGTPAAVGGCGIHLVNKKAEKDNAADTLQNDLHATLCSLPCNSILKVKNERSSGILFKLAFEHFPITNEIEKMVSIGNFRTSSTPLDNAKVNAFHAIATSDVPLFTDTAKQIKNWDFEDPFGSTILQYAAREKNDFFISYLIEGDVDIDARDAGGYSAWHCAAQSGNLNCLKKIFHKAPQIRDTVTKNDETALYLAAQNNHVDCVHFLLSVGANPDHKTKGLKMNALMTSIFLGWDEVALMLLNASSIDLEYALENHLTPLHLAFEFMNESIAYRLCELGANALQCRLDGSTPLHVAAEKGWLNGVNMLLSKCPYIDLNAKTKAGQTALQLALYKEHFEIVDLLQKQGAH